MVDRAIQSAEHLLLGGGSNNALVDGESDGESDAKVWNPVSGLTWTRASNAEFFGEYSHDEDRPGKRAKKIVYPETKAEMQEQEL
jgi:hypothetical protein